MLLSLLLSVVVTAAAADVVVMTLVVISDEHRYGHPHGFAGVGLAGMGASDEHGSPTGEIWVARTHTRQYPHPCLTDKKDKKNL